MKSLKKIFSELLSMVRKSGLSSVIFFWYSEGLFKGLLGRL